MQLCDINIYSAFRLDVVFASRGLVLITSWSIRQDEIKSNTDRQLLWNKCRHYDGIASIVQL